MESKSRMNEMKERKENLWKYTQLFPVDNFGEATKLLTEKLSWTHCNGGVQIHKYKIEGNENFEWFVKRNLFREIDFVKNIITHEDLTGYRKDLKIEETKLKFRKEKEIQRVWGDMDIFTLSGELARILAQGGAYEEAHPYLAWTLATNFIEEAFQNRFNEVVRFDTEIIPVAGWFYKIVWDYSKLLFDKRNYEITLIDITDTD